LIGNCFKYLFKIQILIYINLYNIEENGDNNLKSFSPKAPFIQNVKNSQIIESSKRSQLKRYQANYIK